MHYQKKGKDAARKCVQKLGMLVIYFPELLLLMIFV